MSFIKNFRTLAMICELSPVECHFFNEKNGPRTENAYYLESELLRAK